MARYLSTESSAFMARSPADFTATLANPCATLLCASPPAPSIPTIAAAPAYALIPGVAAPVPAGPLPAIVIPTIVLVIENELYFYNWPCHERQGLRSCAAQADSRCGGVCNRQGDARQERK